jgi:hypothetical protein
MEEAEARHHTPCYPAEYTRVFSPSHARALELPTWGLAFKRRSMSRGL